MWTLRKLLELRPLLVKFFGVKVGDGDSTKLWWDPWHTEGPIYKRGDKEYLEFAELTSNSGK